MFQELVGVTPVISDLEILIVILIHNFGTFKKRFIDKLSSITLTLNDPTNISSAST